MHVQHTADVIWELWDARRHAQRDPPLCPWNVPIQSPVRPSRKIGLPSVTEWSCVSRADVHAEEHASPHTLPLHASMRKKPSSVCAENCTSTTGRWCPTHVNGVGLNTRECRVCVWRIAEGSGIARGAAWCAECAWRDGAAVMFQWRGGELCLFVLF